MKSFSFPSDVPIRPDTVLPLTMRHIPHTDAPPSPAFGGIHAPLSESSPRHTRHRLHAAGRPLLTQELAVLAGKPQEAIASLLEPLLGAGVRCPYRSPGRVGLPRPAGCRAGRIRAPSHPERPSGQPHPCPRAARGSGHDPRRLHRHRRGHRRPISASSGRAASSAWNAHCVS